MVTEGELVLLQDEGEYHAPPRRLRRLEGRRPQRPLLRQPHRPPRPLPRRRHQGGARGRHLLRRRLRHAPQRRPARLHLPRRHPLDRPAMTPEHAYALCMRCAYACASSFSAPCQPADRREAPMAIFTLETDPDGVATIAWDLPGRSMNVLTFEGIAELDAAIDQALADPAVKGIVITSAKPDFAGGMDLNVLARHEESGRRRPRPRPLRRHHVHPPPAPEDRARRHGPEDPQGRQARRLGRPRPLRRHRHRDRPRLPPPLPRRHPEGQRRPPRDPHRHLPRRRRHHPPRPHARPHALRPPPPRRQDARPRRREVRRPDRRGRPPGELLAARQGLGARRRARRHRQALGPEGLQAPRRRPLPPGGLHDLRRRLRHGPRQDPGRLSRRQGHALRHLRGRARRLRHRAAHRGPLVHPRPPRPLLRRDDPHPLPQQAGAREGRLPPARPRPDGEEARHPRRRDDGRRHRHRRRPGRHRGRPPRPRPGSRRPRQGARRRPTSTTA